jgi:hypothetical protein
LATSRPVAGSYTAKWALCGAGGPTPLWSSTMPAAAPQVERGSKLS